MIVVDTNVIAYLWMPGEYSIFAEGALEKDPDWIAPFLWRSEFRNVLAGFIRRGDITLSKSLSVMEQAENQMRGAEFHVSSEDVLRLVKKSHCSSYDCEFVALAQQIGSLLVTTDKQILHEFPKNSIPLRDFANQKT